jgi:ribosomal protein S14
MLRSHFGGPLRLFTSQCLIAGSGKLRLNKLPRGHIIFNDENPRRSVSSCFGCGRPGGLIRSGFNMEKGKIKARAVAGLALDFQLASVQFDEPGTDGKAQARAFGSSARLCQANERLENPLLLFEGDTSAIVANFHSNFVIHLTGGEINASTFGGELDGVADKVHKHLFEAHGVGTKMQTRLDVLK